MSIIINLDKVLFAKKVKSKDLAKAVGITETNLSLLKNNKAKGVRFATLEAICDYLNCEPGEIIGIDRTIKEE